MSGAVLAGVTEYLAGLLSSCVYATRLLYSPSSEEQVCLLMCIWCFRELFLLRLSAGTLALLHDCPIVNEYLVYVLMFVIVSLILRISGFLLTGY